MACQPAHIHGAGVSEFPTSSFHCVTGGMIRKCPYDWTQTCHPVNSVRWSKVHLLCPMVSPQPRDDSCPVSAEFSHLTLLSFLTQPTTSLTSRLRVRKVKADWTESHFRDDHRVRLSIFPKSSVATSHDLTWSSRFFLRPHHEVAHFSLSPIPPLLSPAHHCDWGM